MKLLFTILFFLVTTLCNAQSYTLAQSSRTSAGVYQGNVLVRTLWSGTTQAAGTYTATWDRKLDDLTTDAPPGNYTIKVLSNNVTYTWEGVIGNTSTALSGSSVHKSYSPINGITISGSNAYYAIEYAEGMASQGKFALATPQAKILLNTPSSGAGQTTLFCATDGSTVFWAGCDIYSTNVSTWFIFGSNVSDDNVKNFSGGVAYTTTFGTAYTKIIGRVDDANGVITGMAVQQTANYLFVSHRDLNQIKVYNRTTGAFVRNITFTTPQRLAIDGSDKLWVHSGTNTIARYTVAGDGTISADGTTITGTVEPLYIAVTPDNSKAAIIDGGSSQQVKFYNNTTGAFIESVGQAGGYSTSPVVANDKFYFSDSRDVEARSHPVNAPIRFGKWSSIAFQSNGSYWITDRHNSRLQHFSSANAFIETLQTIPSSRSTRVDPNDSTRVFADYLEFSVDYSKALSPTNGSWTFVKNWGYNMTDEYDIEFYRLRGLTTLSNGRTYAVQQSYTSNLWQVIELTSTGIRFTGVTSANRVNIYKDGSLRRLTYRTIGAATTLYSKPLTGFDGSNNPTWGTETALMVSPLAAASDPLTMAAVGWNEPNLDFTSSNIYIGYEGGVGAQSTSTNYSSKYHLGGIQSNAWLWKTAKNTPDNYTGDYPTNGDYDIWNNVVYAGGPIMLKERSIFWGYHGEFWKDAQANHWQQVYDNGLLLGTFGTDHNTDPSIAAPEMAGNALTAAVVKYGGDYYLYHCDESAHGGIHRWKISGLNTILEQSLLIDSPHVVPVANRGQTSNRVLIKSNTGSALPYVTLSPTGITTGGGGGSDPDFTFQGFGVATTVYGGGTVTHVTNTNATGAGSLHAALLLGGNRRIVFDVGGIINGFRWDSSNESTDETNLVIDGSTAPSPGITINNSAGSAFNFEGSGNHDIVIKYIRVRSATNDCITITNGAYNFIIANCSFSGAGDGLVDITAGSHNVTLQYNIFGAGGDNGSSDKWSGSVLIGFPATKDITVHHNIFVPKTSGGIGERGPFIHNNGGGGATLSYLMADVRNNIDYNFGRNNATGSGYGVGVDYNGTANIINNYGKTSGSTPGNFVTLDADPLGGSGAAAYVSGNLSGNGNSEPSSSHTPVWTVPSQYLPTTQTACIGAQICLDNAGCKYSGVALDATDLAIIASITLTGCP